jgi:cyclopropane-fatty-acyl-phospholipid synthase
MFSPSIELMLAEAFIHGDFDIEGDIEAAFELADFLLAREMPIRDKLRLGGMLMKLPTRARSLTQPDRYGERKS